MRIVATTTLFSCQLQITGSGIVGEIGALQSCMLILRSKYNNVLTKRTIRNQTFPHEDVVVVMKMFNKNSNLRIIGCIYRENKNYSRCLI